MKTAVVCALSLISAPLFAAAPSSAENIDRLFEKAAGLDKDGDCVGAADVYADIVGLSSTLLVADKKRIDAQVKTRLAKNKDCVESCTMSDKNKRMFDTLKQAQSDGEMKRTAEMCKVLLHGKNAKCPAWNEVRAFCPQLGENGDPCGVSAETAAELEALNKDVDVLEKRAAKAAATIKTDNPKGMDAVSPTARSTPLTSTSSICASVTSRVTKSTAASK